MGNACSLISEPICEHCHERLEVSETITLDLGIEVISIQFGRACKCSCRLHKANASGQSAGAAYTIRQPAHEKITSSKHPLYLGEWNAASTDCDCQSIVTTAETSLPRDQISDWSSRCEGMATPRSVPSGDPQGPEMPAARVLQAFMASLKRFEALDSESRLKGAFAKKAAESTLAGAVEGAETPEALNSIICMAKLAGVGQEALQKARIKQWNMQCGRDSRCGGHKECKGNPTDEEQRLRASEQTCNVVYDFGRKKKKSHLQRRQRPSARSKPAKEAAAGAAGEELRQSEHLEADSKAGAMEQKRRECQDAKEELAAAMECGDAGALAAAIQKAEEAGQARDDQNPKQLPRVLQEFRTLGRARSRLLELRMGIAMEVREQLLEAQHAADQSLAEARHAWTEAFVALSVVKTTKAIGKKVDAIMEIAEEDDDEIAEVDAPGCWQRQETGASAVSTATGASLESFGSD